MRKVISFVFQLVLLIIGWIILLTGEVPDPHVIWAITLFALAHLMGKEDQS